jgi:rubrerythrin
MTANELFRASEMLDMAVHIERRGVAFYEGCVNSETDPSVKDMFHYLMNQEKEHARVFSGMREKLEDD